MNAREEWIAEAERLAEAWVYAHYDAVEAAQITGGMSPISSAPQEAAFRAFVRTVRNT